ncbi:hypothetical protein ANCCEY_13990 [Ancylostoma ceylanicum]|uniref:Uncharacterized protein n=1 Tax=Ancylostoma ceylanicum TaxID=53326 RepID=A0A0D6L6A8_9BILA|nr:hypothetical protein ANCCEY_13990 [Ancylostoma ceylanicum]
MYLSVLLVALVVLCAFVAETEAQYYYSPYYSYGYYGYPSYYSYYGYPSYYGYYETEAVNAQIIEHLPLQFQYIKASVYPGKCLYAWFEQKSI